MYNLDQLLVDELSFFFPLRILYNKMILLACPRREENAISSLKLRYDFIFLIQRVRYNEIQRVRYDFIIFIQRVFPT